MDILTPQTTEERLETPTPTGALDSGVPMSQFALREYFDTWQPGLQEQDVFNAITEIAKGRGIIAKGDLFQLLRDVEMKVGAQNNRPRAVLRYLQVLNQIDDLTKVKNSYEYGR